MTKSEARVQMSELIADMQDRDWRTSTEPYPIEGELWVTFCPHPRDCGHKLGHESDFDLQYNVRSDRFDLVRVDGLCIELVSEPEECPSIYSVEESIARFMTLTKPTSSLDFIDWTAV